MTKINGTYTALVTPFDNDYSIDYKSLETLIGDQFDNGINQFVVCGSTGEGTLLNAEEKKEIIEKSIEIIDGSGTVGVGCSAGSMTEAVALVSLAQSCDADFALVAPPYYVKPSQDGIVKFYTEISNKVSFPVVAYNIPSRVGVAMSFDTLLKISKIPNVIGLKDATPSFETISRLSTACGSNFSILSGDDLTFPASLLYGTCGTISAIANYCPKLINDFYKSWQNGQIDIKLVHKIVEINRASSLASNPIALKYMLSKKGLIKNVLRHPLSPLDEEKMKVVDGLFDHVSKCK